ncbi:transcriptional regulator [Saccharibacillus sp. O23]|uniref:winged helix-turn-helix transcriptional regulator n=1 Tax=Saccharibacillus sp. O23 TaxID=2009338 RepID=UPI000B4DFA66|nr:helix-turn-helix domain-containing protein [Saccharibacillus sp. O23]OWR28458.1 transcriptional regulator [Saccharibacillus sp. O23]
MENPEKDDESPYTCPVAVTVDVIGGKWKGIVLYHLIEGAVRFNELRKLMPGTTQRMLTLQLRELERDGLVHREIYHQMPPKVEYSLTGFGRTLIPILDLMRNWGIEHERDIVDRRKVVDKELPE